MNQLIPIENKGGVDVVESIVFAAELGVEHRATLQMIDKYQPEIEKLFGQVTFEMRAGYNNAQIRVAHLNEGQAMYLANLSRNSEQVVEFKGRLVKSFIAARDFVHQITAPMTPAEMKLQVFKMLEQEAESLREQLALANSTIEKQAPAVMYHNQVLTSNNTYTTTSIAKELGMGAKGLNQLLKKAGVQYFHDGHWVLYSQHQHKGFTQTRTHTYYDSENKQQTSLQTVWTEKGRQFIHSKVNPLLSVNHSLPAA